ncbi:MAG: class I SAM-dependent methyltransferase, partial [Spirochaetia bacterium]|nr:class I SAM-dependent methyltransferase [Spirochaetia bacterium]
MKEVLISVFNRLENEQSYNIIFPDGDRYTHGSGAPQFVIHFKTWEAVKDAMTRGSMGFGESYMSEEIDIQGDVQDVSALGFRVLDEHLDVSLSEKLRFAVGYFSRRNTLHGSRKNIAAHYDLGNDFYGLWLDKEMQYTCAYFETPNDTIEQAQIQKLDLVCRKLMLKPGETIVEAGCGWGGLGLFMARNYGARVRSYNISKEQIAYARDRASRLGIPHDRLEYVHDDYRT